jgi:hypothetical protein
MGLGDLPYLLCKRGMDFHSGFASCRLYRSMKVSSGGNSDEDERHGIAIYRTCYANVSDEDWARAIEKLDEACLASLEFYESAYSKGHRPIVYADVE